VLTLLTESTDINHKKDISCDAGVNAKRIKRTRILIKALEFESKERSCKTTQKNMAQLGAGTH
jgi:hypothetical protein